VEVDGVVVAYVSDHQQPVDGGPISPAVLELCDGADLVIHDAQYEPAEFALKSDWGHCTVEFAVRVAAEAGAKRLALFHHDPSHGDDVVDRLRREAEAFAVGTSLTEVMAAAEGLTVSLTAAAVSDVAAVGA
jgi:ribonuclease BN (tRNA processing enzyme)